MERRMAVCQCLDRWGDLVRLICIYFLCWYNVYENLVYPLPKNTGITIPYKEKTWRFVDENGKNEKQIILKNTDEKDTKNTTIILHRPEEFDNLDDIDKYNKIVYLLSPYKGGRKSRGRKSRRRKPTRRRRR